MEYQNPSQSFIEKIATHKYFALIAICVISIIGTIGFVMFNMNLQTEITRIHQQNTELQISLNTLKSEFATTTELLATNIAEARNNLTNRIEQEKNSVNEQLGNVKGEVGSLSGTLTNLEKLSKTDAELLQKYSKVYFLNEHYQPVSLTELPSEYVYSEQKTYQFHTQAWGYLQNMIDAAERDNIDLYVFSAFRSFNTQAALKGQYTVTYGSGTANQFSADQGYSEHQLGTALDFMTTGIGGVLDKFGTTHAYTWLLNNAYKYGFVLSYPEHNDYYIFEPWHWRFVGKALANDLHNSGKNFYDLEQREIDAYLVNLFD